ncbi:glutamine amidotransferase [Rhizobium sp. Root1203]|uniref:type 1 glutamine amidotransferase n=1 Tax=Rhizobium sp. Root1203 TaxID=1736427 RepID=UPI000709060C|nr:type 1 glutamine amidotransferase [Rhizobium sp. Root1203]KQV31895.1 glutamine amidotransferase [Rhizobium sp. Root1203]
MRVAVVENMKSTPLGSLGIALAEAHAEIEYFRPWIDGRLPRGIFDHDALVVLGGEQNALDDESYPYLPALARLMHRFSESGKAVLGICLGAQILARAYGAENRLDLALEFGWRSVGMTQDGKADPLLAGLGDAFTTFQWHSDSFTLPQGARRLATSELAENQAFRVGRAAYGTQFHFEANGEVVDSWTVEFQATIDRMEPGWLGRYPSLSAANAADADMNGVAIARNWVRMIEVTVDGNEARPERQAVAG